MRKVFNAYKNGWRCTLSHYRIILFIFLVNLVLAFIAISPLSMAIEDAFDSNGQLGQLMSSFDYALVSDFLRLYRLNVSSAIGFIIPLSIIYLIFYSFIYGGLARIAINGMDRMEFSTFLSSCARYFWKMLVLTLLTIIVFGIVFFILFKFFAQEGFNPFALESEMGLISRFWISISVLILVFFILTTIRDFTKISIVEDLSRRLMPSVREGFSRTFKPVNLVLSMLNILVLIVILYAYHRFKISVGEFSLSVLLIGQLIIIFRIAYKLIRLASFSFILKENDDV